ncbi:hypothetical protein DFJ67_1442 [Asanoa ferruginea]|uniref:LPXTG-motif cell wall-anchored protein n=1 Tax=Asanoa ferruginea TaxID=53367 RepID=A0A3D9ZG57_9ACTN|nr:hypothetical protein [Asanoa ferruginea]REF95484.1 hypothetical protein DFJ67_1442 [Asanoa ferruginea]GIF46752.1 hypothetical protein Afe04nite_12910 [Asanoa ferruginea]
MRGRSLGAALAAAAIGGGLGVAVPTVASAEMYVDVLPTSVPATAAEVGKHACEARLGGGPYPDRDVWLFQLPGDRVRTGDIVALSATFTTPDGQEVSRKAPGDGAGIADTRAWLVVDKGGRLTAATAAITGTVRNLAIAQTCPAESSPQASPTEPAVFGEAVVAPMLDPVAGRATPTPTPTPTPTVTPTARPTPTPTATPTLGLADLPHGSVDLTEPDADPVPAPAPVVPPAVTDPGQVDTTGYYSDGAGVPGIVPDTAFSDGGVYPNGGVVPGSEFGGYVDNGGVIDNGGIPADPGAVLGGDPGTSFGGNGSFSGGSGSFSDGGGSFSDGGGSVGSFGGDQGGAMGDAGDLVNEPTGDTPSGNPIAAATASTTGINVSGAGSATSAEVDNQPSDVDGGNPATTPAATGSAAPAAVTLRSDDNRLVGNANVLRLAGVLLVFVLAGVGMALIRRRRRGRPRLIGRHRAA